MLPAPFALERYFARHEFSARYLLSASDCQGPAMADLVRGAGPELRRRWDGLRLGYTESQGLPELRAAIAGTYECVGPEQVLVAAPEELIFLAMHSLLMPGDHVICTYPGYQSLYELARSIGCEVDLWEPEEGLGAAAASGPSPEARANAPAGAGWRFDPAGLESLLRPRTKLVVWNFPHNPTGALPSPGDFTRMVEAVARAGAWLFSDEMYRLLEPSPERRLPAAVDLYDRALSLAGMSKSFGLAGLRIGWVAARDHAALATIQELKDYTTICSSAPSEILALMALESAESILSVNRARVARNTETAARFFDSHGDVMSWAPPQAGTVCFPRLVGAPGGRGGGGASGPGGGGPAGPAGAGSEGGPGAVEPGAEAFCARLLAETGALLLPSTVYGYGDAHFRLGLGRDDFGDGLAALDRYLRAAAG